MDRAVGKPVLRVSNLHVDHGREPVVHGVSFEVRDAEIVVLLGPRLAGKTTILASIAGLTSIRDGTIEFHDGTQWIDLVSLPVHARPELGIFLVAAEEPVLPRFTVEKNLRVGAYLRGDKREIERDMERQYDLVPMLRLQRERLAGHLSGGDQRMLSITRALMGRPRFLLLDEPSRGLSGRIVDELFAVIRSLNRDSSLSGLIVEKNLKKGVEVADHVYVLRYGSIVYTAPSGAAPDQESIEEAFAGAPGGSWGMT